MLFNIHTLQWDDELLKLLRRPARACCPRCARRARSTADVSTTLGARRACRSPASPATSRRRCSARCAVSPGMTKNTYGTGCFLLQNTGTTPIASQQQPADDGRVADRRRDRVRARRQRVHRRRGGAVAARRPRHHPHVGRDRGAGGDACPTTAASTSCRRSPASARRTGIRTRAARSSASRAARRPAHIARAALESIAFQVADLLDAMQADAGIAAAPSCASTAARRPTTC